MTQRGCWRGLRRSRRRGWSRTLWNYKEWGWPRITGGESAGQITMVVRLQIAWHYLGITKRPWEISRIWGNAEMRTEWRRNAFVVFPYLFAVISGSISWSLLNGWWWGYNNAYHMFCFPTISSFTWNCLAGIILEEIIAMNSWIIFCFLQNKNKISH